MKQIDVQLNKIVLRCEEIQEFESFLRKETNWSIAPASTRFHLCKEGGLIEHSLNVVKILMKLRETLAPEISEESCIIVGLYHDVGKVGMPGKPYYLPNPDKTNITRPYIVNPKLVHLDIASRSLYLISKYVDISEEEIQAIRFHDGQYILENRSVAHRETKLTRLLQYADNWSGGVIESKI